MSPETSERPKTPLIVAAVFALLLAGAAFVQWGNYFVDSDGRAIYAATLGVFHGVSPYDELGQAALLSEALGEERTVLPFGYPPWYVLTALPMGLLEYPPAERLFVLYNLGWLALGTVFLARRREEELSGTTALVAGLYMPVLGQIAVGQMTLPVYAGLALGLYGMHRKQPWVLAVAAFLMSYKWHIGAIPALAFLVLLLRDRRLFARTAGPLVAVFALGSVGGLLLDPRWPVTYARSVIDLSGADVNNVCDTCSSVAWTLSTRLPLPTSVFGGFLLLVGWGAMAGRGLVRDTRGFVAAMIALALVALPYARNYDYAIFAVALAVAVERSRTAVERGVVGACWLASLAVVVAPRTWSDEILGGSALVLFGLLLVQGPGRDIEDLPLP